MKVFARTFFREHPHLAIPLLAFLFGFGICWICYRLCHKIFFNAIKVNQTLLYIYCLVGAILWGLVTMNEMPKADESKQKSKLSFELRLYPKNDEPTLNKQTFLKQVYADKQYLSEQWQQTITNIKTNKRQVPQAHEIGLKNLQNSLNFINSTLDTNSSFNYSDFITNFVTTSSNNLKSIPFNRCNEVVFRSTNSQSLDEKLKNGTATMMDALVAQQYLGINLSNYGYQPPFNAEFALICETSLYDYMVLDLSINTAVELSQNSTWKKDGTIQYDFDKAEKDGFSATQVIDILKSEIDINWQLISQRTNNDINAIYWTLYLYNTENGFIPLRDEQETNTNLNALLLACFLNFAVTLVAFVFAKFILTPLSAEVYEKEKNLVGVRVMKLLFGVVIAIGVAWTFIFAADIVKDSVSLSFNKLKEFLSLFLILVTPLFFILWGISYIAFGSGNPFFVFKYKPNQRRKKDDTAEYIDTEIVE